MYKLIYCLLLIVNFSTYAKSRPLKVLYEFKDFDETRNMVLIFDDTSSLCVYNRIDFDSELLTRNSFGVDATNGQIKRISLDIKAYDSIGKTVYRNFNSEQIICREPSYGKLPSFTIIDQWETINWVINKKKRKWINGIKCQKAIGEFRGRVYTAWFADSIKVPYGPWKLFGLPGLIVYAHDKDKQIEFKIIDIEKIRSGYEIDPIFGDTVVSMKEYVDYNDKRSWHFYTKFKSAAKEYSEMMGMEEVRIDNYSRYSSFYQERQKQLERKYEFEADGYLFNQSRFKEKSKANQKSETYNYDK